MEQPVESLHASMAHVMAEIKGLAACTTSLNEILNEKTDQILTHINSLEARVNSLEGSVSEGTTGTCQRNWVWVLGPLSANTPR